MPIADRQVGPCRFLRKGPRPLGDRNRLLDGSFELILLAEILPVHHFRMVDSSQIQQCRMVKTVAATISAKTVRAESNCSTIVKAIPRRNCAT